MENIWIALGLTLFAGLATGIGSALAFLADDLTFVFVNRHRRTSWRHALCLLCRIFEGLTLVTTMAIHWVIGLPRLLLWRACADRHHRCAHTACRKST